MDKHHIRYIMWS